MQHAKKKSLKPKGSTVIIVFMYLTWILYLGFQLHVRTKTGAWLPSEVTYGTAALFIVETVSLARLKLAKEGNEIPEQQNNVFLSKLGLNSLETFEQDVQEVSKKNIATKQQQQTQGRQTGASMSLPNKYQSKGESCQTKSCANSQVVNSGSQSQHS